MRTLKELTLLIILVSGMVCSNARSQEIVMPDHSALLIIDVQEKFIKGKKYEQEAIDMIGYLNVMLDKMDPENVIYIQAGGKVLNLSFKKKSVDTLIFPIDGRLKRINDQVFTKFAGDAFSQSELVDFLRKRGIHDVFLTGLLAEKCVYSTALGGLEKGFNVYLLPEGIIGKSRGSKDKAIGKMSQKGVKTLSFD